MGPVTEAVGRSETATVDVGMEIDRAAIRGFHWLVVVLCGLVYLFDGFDTQVIAFVAPAIAEDWHQPVTDFGPAFAAGLFGALVGALVMGPLADRHGRRALVITSTILFGVFSLATPFCASVPELIVIRFLTGLGLGGAMPNIVALTAEYMPARHRTMMVTLMSCGFSAGGLVGGLIASAVVPARGWQAMFYLGGIIPLLHAVFLIWLLPESIRFAVQREPRSDRVAGWLGRLTGAVYHARTQAFILADPKPPGGPVLQLFRGHRSGRTLLLWLMFFMNFYVTFSLINWLPAIVRQTGAPMSLALTAAVLLNLGTLSGVLTAWLADKWGAPRVAAIAFALAAVCVGGMGLAEGSAGVLLGLCFLAGLFNNGTTFIGNAVAAHLYPTAIRTTGVGWAQGIGRLGSIIGPLLAGAMLVAHWALPQIFLVTAVADAMAALAAIGLAFVARDAFRRVGGVSGGAYPPSYQPAARQNGK